MRLQDLIDGPAYPQRAVDGRRELERARRLLAQAQKTARKSADMAAARDAITEALLYVDKARAVLLRLTTRQQDEATLQA